MNNNSQRNVCAHPACACQIPAGQTYCGPHCANQAARVRLEEIETACACGHDACAHDDRTSVLP